MTDPYSMVHDLAKEVRRLQGLAQQEDDDALAHVPEDCQEVIVVAYDQLREGKREG